MASSPSLAHFPSVCLEAIFKRVPLVDLLRCVGLVCSSWHKSRHTELMRRRRLVIVRDAEILDKPYNVMQSTEGTDLLQHVRRDDGSAWLSLESIDRIKLDSLVIPNGLLTTPLTASLMNISNISHLVLIFEYVSNSTLVQITHLMGHLVDKLVNLKLSFSMDERSYNEDELAHSVTNLFVCLNRMQSLKHLTLELSILSIHRRLQLPIKLSFLSRLTTLTCTWSNSIFDSILTSLGQYGANIGSIKMYNWDGPSKVLQAGHQLNHKFTALDMMIYDVQEFDDLRLLCGRFSSLTSLVIGVWRFEPIQMTMFGRYLSQLTQLVHLGLNFYNLTDDDEQVEQPGQIAQIPSVRLLTLDIGTYSHHDTERFFVPEMFPNLQVLRLEHCIYKCADCEIDLNNTRTIHQIEDSSPELALRLVRCRRLARRPFRACANLHTIALWPITSSDKDFMITRNEL